MFLCLCLILLLCGCFNQNHDDYHSKSVILHTSGIKWSLQHKDQTDTERFATNLWVDKVKQKIHFIDSGKPISIAIIKSSFIDMPDKLEFKIKLLCKNPRTKVDFKIKVKGSAEIDGTGSAVDVVTDEIAKQVLEKLEYEYGQTHRPHLLPRTATVNYNGEMTDLINTTKKQEIIPAKPVTMGEQVDLAQVNSNQKVLETQKQPEIKAPDKAPEKIAEAPKSATVDLAKSATETSTNLVSNNNPRTNNNTTLDNANNIAALATKVESIANTAVDAGKRYENLVN